MAGDEFGRGLLLAVLALQNDFLSRERLLEVFSEWVANKATPVEALLQKPGRLSAEQRAVLGPLADMHLRESGGDVEESLVGLSGVSGVLAELRRLGDADLLKSIGRLGSDEETAVPGEGAAGPDDGASVPEADRFRVLGRHAEGGLGTVSVAEDRQFRRRVAFKQIKGRFADDSQARGRFLLEAEVTGGLEHPGIVPVYGLGRDADGRPFYAMRFVRGETLKDVAEGFHTSGEPFDSVAFRKLLGHFGDVCQAIAYAHSRGVLHRDLKPANVMLGRFGETLVVDWGLAKVEGESAADPAGDDGARLRLSGSGSVETLAGSAVGTPAYMPPEQAAGRLEEVGPASDVYALGATLYSILCGRPPFRGEDLPALLRRVQEGDVESPRGVREDVPKALEAVCLKAMSLRPRDRYGSPKELADEIERWLADEPVAAAAEPPSARARRWVRKHPRLVAGTAAAVLVSLVGSAAFAGVLRGKNAELTQANAAERAARVAAEDAKEVARRSEALAGRRTRTAVRTLAAVVNDLQRGLKGLPGGRGVRTRILQSALPPLEEIAEEVFAGPAPDLTQATALTDLADLLLTSGEVAASAPPGGEGAVSSALRLAEQARDVARRFAEAGGPAADWRRTEAVAEQRIGDASRRLGDLAAAAAAYDRSLAIWEGLMRSEGRTESLLGQATVSLRRVAEARLAASDLPAARGLAGRSEAASSELLGLTPESPEALGLRPPAFDLLGEIAMAEGDLAAAEAAFAKAAAAAGRWRERIPNAPEAVNAEAVAADKAAEVRLRMGDAAGAAAGFERSLRLRRDLAADDPTDRAARRAVSVSLGNLSQARAAAGEMAAAVELAEESSRVREELAADAPEDAAAARDVFVALLRLSRLRSSTGDVAGGLADATRAAEVAAKLAGADPANAAAARDAAAGFDLLGNARQAAGDLGGAREAFNSALELARKLAAGGDSAAARRDLLVSLSRAASLAARAGDLDAARAASGEALETARSIAERYPDDVSARRDVGILLAEAGGVAADAGDREAAARHYGEALEVARGVAAEEPENPAFRRTVSVALNNIAEVRSGAGDFGAALGALRESLAIREALAAESPASASARRGVAVTLNRLGDTLTRSGDAATAEGHHRRAVTVAETLIEEDPANGDASRTLAASLDGLGQALLAGADVAAADGVFRRYLRLAKERAAADPADPQRRRGVAVAHSKVAETAGEAGDKEAAAESLRRAVEAIDAAAEAGVRWPDAAELRSLFLSQLEKVAGGDAGAD